MMHYLQQELYDRIKSDDAIFDFLQKSALDGMWYWDLTDQAHEWMNEEFWTTLGYDPSDKPHLASAWQDIINPEDLQAAIARVGEHLADPSVPYDQVVRYTHADGHTVWIRCRGLAIRDDAGQPIRLLGAHVDITAEKEKEALLEKSQQIARIGTWEVNMLTGKLYWNDLTKAIHEVPQDFEPDLATGINFYREGDSRRIISELFERAITEGEPYDTELQLVTATGRNVWVRAIGQPEFADGICKRVYGVFQDIDERKRGEDRLLNYSILEAKSKEMEQFAYAASHDLREPLLTIKGYIDVIREDYAGVLPDEVTEHLETITGAAKRMDELIQGLLDYSRLSTVKQWQEVNLRAILNQVTTDLRPALEAANATVDYDSLPAVNGYPLELKILLHNLVSNAIKYRRPEVPLRIDFSCEELEDSYRITVQDNGIGMPEHQLEVIFQLFRQLHAGADTRGSGIGLANAKKIVELHGGEIWATSEEGKGSAFHFTVQKEA